MLDFLHFVHPGMSVKKQILVGIRKAEREGDLIIIIFKAMTELQTILLLIPLNSLLIEPESAQIAIIALILECSPSTLPTDIPLPELLLGVHADFHAFRK